MTADDEILFGYAWDESRWTYERVKRLRAGAEEGITRDLAFALADFELQGATLQSLRRWYPDEDRVREAVADWESLTTELAL